MKSSHRLNLLRLAFLELKARHARTKLAMFWIFIPQLIYIYIATFIFGNLTGENNGRGLIQTATGLCVWIYFSEGFMQIANVYADNRGALLSYNYPWYWFPMKILLRIAITMMPMTLFLCFTATYYFEFSVITSVIFAVAYVFGVLMVCLVGLLFSVPILLFRDIQPLLSLLMQVLFFMSPVGWVKIDSKFIMGFNYFNPLYYLITLLREIENGSVDIALLLMLKLFSICLIIFIISYFMVVRWYKRLSVYI